MFRFLHHFGFCALLQDPDRQTHTHTHTPSYCQNKRTPALPSPPQDATPPLPTAATSRLLREHPPTKARRPTAGINNPAVATAATEVVPCPLCLVLLILMRDRGLVLTLSEGSILWWWRAALLFNAGGGLDSSAARCCLVLGVRVVGRLSQIGGARRHARPPCRPAGDKRRGSRPCI